MRRLHTLGALVTTCAVLTLTGCADDEPEVDPSPTASSTPGGGESSPTDPTTSEATVEPADGELLQSGDTAYARVPAGWKVDDFDYGFGIQQASKGLSTITWADLGTIPVTTPREMVKVEKQGNLGSNPQISYDVELGGEPAYMITSGSGPSQHVQFGAVRGGNGATIGFSLDHELPEAEQQEIVDSVLASFTWS